MPEWLNSTKGRGVIIAVAVIVAALGVWWFTRPAPAANTGTTTFNDLVDEEAVDELNEAPAEPYREQVRVVASQLRQLASPQFAEGVRETMLAIVEPDVEDMLQTWRDQGRTPQADGFPGEGGTLQEMHEHRRASLLRAEFRPSQIAIVDPEQNEKLADHRDDWGMNLTGEQTRRRDGQLAFAKGSIPRDERSEVLIPGMFYNMKGEPMEGVLAIGMVWNPEQSRWVMLSIGYYVNGQPAQAMIPLF